MTNEEKQKFLDMVIPLLENMKPVDWELINACISMRFSGKAAQCKLDGSDLELIKKNIERDWVS